MRISDWSSDVCSSDLNTSYIDERPARLDIDVARRGQHDQGQASGFALDMGSRAMDPGGIFRSFHDQGAASESITATGRKRKNTVSPAALRCEHRTEKRRVGTAGVSTCKTRWSP